MYWDIAHFSEMSIKAQTFAHLILGTRANSVSETREVGLLGNPVCTEKGHQKKVPFQ